MQRATSFSTARGEWLAARAALAARRLRRTRPFALSGAVVLLLAAAGWQFRGSATAPLRAARTPSMVDTMALRESRDTVERALSAHDSALRALSSAVRTRAMPTPPLTSVSGDAVADTLRRLIAALDSALERTAKSPLPTSYRALASTRALRQVSGVQPLVDTLNLLEDVRRSLDPVEAPQREFAQLSERVNAIGLALQSIGQDRRAALQRQLAARTRPVPDEVDTTEALVARIRAARDSVARRARTLDSLLDEARNPSTTAMLPNAASPPVRIFGAAPLTVAVSLIVIVVALSFTIAIVVEARAPTIGDAREAERIAGVPAMATLRRMRVTPGDRLTPRTGGNDAALRMVYLALTTDDTRPRAVCITGDEAGRTAAVAGRLAVNAASDERATLAVDLAPGAPSTSANLGWKDQSGFTEAIAGVRLWREVARSVGASEGLDLDVIPSGAPRADTESSVADATLRGEFTTFADDYDFTVLVAPTHTSLRWAVMLAPTVPLLLVVRLGKTRLAALRSIVSECMELSKKPDGIVLIDDY